MERFCSYHLPMSRGTGPVVWSRGSPRVRVEYHWCPRAHAYVVWTIKAWTTNGSSLFAVLYVLHVVLYLYHLVRVRICQMVDSYHVLWLSLGHVFVLHTECFLTNEVSFSSFYYKYELSSFNLMLSVKWLESVELAYCLGVGLGAQLCERDFCQLLLVSDVLAMYCTLMSYVVWISLNGECDIFLDECS